MPVLGKARIGALMMLSVKLSSQTGKKVPLYMLIVLWPLCFVPGTFLGTFLGTFQATGQEGPKEMQGRRLGSHYRKDPGKATSNYHSRMDKPHKAE